MSAGVGAERTADIAERVEAFVREVVVPYGKDPAAITTIARAMTWLPD